VVAAKSTQFLFKVFAKIAALAAGVAGLIKVLAAMEHTKMVAAEILILVLVVVVVLLRLHLLIALFLTITLIPAQVHLL
jgi:hypothetical protein